MSDRNESIRLKLLEMGIEFITFSQYWYSDVTFPLHAKAWASNGTEIQLSDTIWEQTRWSLHKVLKPVPVEANEKVFGWHLKNNTLQMAAHDLEFTNEFGDYDALDEGTRIAYEQRTREWGIAADPNYKYEVSNDLKVMLEAAQWSQKTVSAQELLEVYMQHPDEFVRSSLAANPNVSEAVLVKLAEDQSAFVRNSVRMNPNVPMWIKEAIGGYLE
jgi:hypothetical protein